MPPTLASAERCGCTAAGACSCGVAATVAISRVAQRRRWRDRLQACGQGRSYPDQLPRLRVRPVAGREVLADRSLLVGLDGPEGVGGGELVDALADHRLASSWTTCSAAGSGAPDVPASASRSLASASRSRPFAVPGATPVTSATSR